MLRSSIKIAWSYANGNFMTSKCASKLTKGELY